MSSTPTRDDFVSSYKKLLRSIIERNPSGLRLKLAKELSTHKSFISQITNPLDPTPIPAKHIPALFTLCHFSRDEESRFLAAFRSAHPNRAQKAVEKRAAKRKSKFIKVEVPVVDDPQRQKSIESLVAEFARRLHDIC